MGQHEDKTFMINFSIVLALLALLGIIIYVIAQFAGDVDGDQQAALAYEKAQERTMPVSKLCIEGDDCGANAESASGGEQAAATPADIYSASCAACHGTGALGAPKLGDVAAWGARAGKGVETLISNAINGINTMPARGGNAALTDDEVKAVVEYMLSESGQ